MVVAEDSNIQPHAGTYLIAAVRWYFMVGMALKFVMTPRTDTEFTLSGG